MEFLLIFVMCLIGCVIYDAIKKELVYNDSPADPTYKTVLVTITIDCNDDGYNFKEKIYNVQKILYISNQLDLDKACDYIHSHKNLYDNELKEIEKKFTNQYNQIPIIKSTSISIDEL